MNKQKIFFILSIIGIILLLILSQNSFEKISGKIEKIIYQDGAIKIYIKNESKEILLFTKKIINLKENDKIIVVGKKYEINKIIANKIILQNDS